MGKTKSRASKRRKSKEGTASHVKAQTLESLKKKKRSEVRKKKRAEVRKKKRGEQKKKKRMAEQDEVETAGEMPAEADSWKGKMEELVKLLTDHQLDERHGDSVRKRVHEILEGVSSLGG